MREPVLRFPVTCPDCALESLWEMPIALIADALLTGKGIRFHSHCHDLYWTATFAEREQLRTSLALLNLENFRVSKPEKIRHRHEHHAYHDEQNVIGYKIREHHQAQSTQQGHHRPLLSPIDDKSESYGPEQQSPKQ